MSKYNWCIIWKLIRWMKEFNSKMKSLLFQQKDPRSSVPITEECQWESKTRFFVCLSRGVSICIKIKESRKRWLLMTQWTQHQWFVRMRRVCDLFIVSIESQLVFRSTAVQLLVTVTLGECDRVFDDIGTAGDFKTWVESVNFMRF